MTRRKDGRWQECLTIQEGGRPVRKFFYGKTKQEVLRKVAAFEERRKRGRSFAEIAADWWERTEPRISPTTAKSYRPAMHRAVERFGTTPVGEIKPAHISSFISAFESRFSASYKTVYNQLSVMTCILQRAVELGDLDHNPAKSVTMPRGLERGKRGAPTDEDIARIKRSTDCTFGEFAYWALYTGMRRGELLALTYEDIDMKNAVICINKSVYYINTLPHLKAPKTEAGVRPIPILDRLGEHIRPGSGLVFPSPKTGGLMPEYTFRRLWAAYCAESGVSCTVHQLRHAFATMLYENDVPEKDAQELMGHADIATTRSIYTHIRDSRRQKIYSTLRSADL